ncbi:hypothetical protein [Rhodococcus sp. NPDC003383]
MRPFAEAWPQEIVQQPVAQLPWVHVTAEVGQPDRRPRTHLICHPGRRARLIPQRPRPPDRRAPAPSDRRSPV